MSTALSPRDERFFLLTLAGIQFSHILDFMIMMPLGPVLMKAFGIGTHEFGLLVASYSFSAAISGILAATFVDLFERKRLLLIAFGLFALSTLACALAPSYSMLMVARGLAGGGRNGEGHGVCSLAALAMAPLHRRMHALSIRRAPSW